jgi:hypothetical protein
MHAVAKANSAAERAHSAVRTQYAPTFADRRAIFEAHGGAHLDADLARQRSLPAPRPDQQLALVRRLAERTRRGEREIREEIVPLADAMAEENGARFPAITARLGAGLFGFFADYMERLEQDLVSSST